MTSIRTKLGGSALALAATALALVAATAGTASVQALITGKQIKDGTVESRDIRNGTIRRADMHAAAVASLRGLRGPAGAAGPAGPAGAQGPAGPAGATGSQGPAGPQGPQGPQGEKGEPGAGVHVTGSVPTEDDLPASGEEGDAYIVTSTGHLHVWDGEAFVDTGPVRGPAGLQGETGPAGATGPAGPAGPAGPSGADGADGGLAGYEVVTGAAVAVPEGELVVRTTACPAGKVALGGGVRFGDPLGGLTLVETYPAAGGSGWTVSAYNWDVEDTMTPYAVCAGAA